MNATVNYAVYNSTRLYASGEADLDQEFPKVYVWAQCTPDLTPERCRDCLLQKRIMFLLLLSRRECGKSWWGEAAWLNAQYSLVVTTDLFMRLASGETPLRLGGERGVHDVLDGGRRSSSAW
jgi:hypothetical protein